MSRSVSGLYIFKAFNKYDISATSFATPSPSGMPLANGCVSDCAYTTSDQPSEFVNHSRGCELNIQHKNVVSNIAPSHSIPAQKV